MSIPKEPRQIMINLMYLVLTAMLALNVTSEILNAFKVLSRSMEASNMAIENKTNATYAQFIENEKTPGQYSRVHPYRVVADAVKDSADKMVAYLQDWQKRIVLRSGGWKKSDSSIVKEEDIDATTALLVDNKGGDTLREKIASLRNFLLSAVGQDSARIRKLMPLKVEPARKTEANPKADWNIGYFEHMPVVAAMALFSKFQNDVRSSEQLVMNTLFDQAHLTEIKFDTMTALAIPQTNYALDGDLVKADILFAAFNKNLRPTVTISSGGGSYKDATDGVVPWETVATGSGLQTVKGNLSMKTDTGMVTKPFSFQYMVGSSGSSVGLDKMNVFYIGVPNPITIAAAGYTVEDVKPGDIPGITFTGGKGHYEAYATKPGNVQLEVLAKTKDGTTRSVGTHLIRVKKLPNPTAVVANQYQGDMPANVFRPQIAPLAVMPPEFDFDVHFKIISFQVYIAAYKSDVAGPFNVGPGKNAARFSDNPELEKYKSRIRPGDRIFIQFIKAIGPDGEVRSLNPITLTMF